MYIRKNSVGNHWPFNYKKKKIHKCAARGIPEGKKKKSKKT